MFGLKQFLVLALAGTSLACQCTTDGVHHGDVDVSATESACRQVGGNIYNGQTVDVQCGQMCHKAFNYWCEKMTHEFSERRSLKSSCGGDLYGCRLRKGPGAK
ncbi:Crossover junction endonuclease mus81 [Venturia nashicola]|uniref:Crossover junction endonuclease mus81 n=1 Tax=Venturia nashicola TaxID=86259 RepID=A0A4Z1PAM5_9PEZI|nr:Crossover junction endonuclease mus81 [Venturia nashicola]